MAISSKTLEVVGPHRGKTFTFRGRTFVDGRITISGHPEQLKGACTYLERTVQAFPVGSPELQEAILRIHPEEAGKLKSNAAAAEEAAALARERAAKEKAEAEAAARAAAKAEEKAAREKAEAEAAAEDLKVAEELAAAAKKEAGDGVPETDAAQQERKTEPVSGAVQPVSEPPAAAAAAVKSGADAAPTGNAGRVPQGSGQGRAGAKVKASF